MSSSRDTSGTRTGDEFVVTVDSARSLTELTATINDVCRRADEGEATTAVLELGNTSPALRGWPGGAVSVQEINRWERALRRLERAAAVTISTVSGTCGGPALDVLLATDRRICMNDARLLFPVNQGQFWPGMAVYRLANHVGNAHARRIVMWGSEVTAEQALAIGLVDEVTTDLSDAVRSLALLIAKEPVDDLAVRRRLVLEASASSYEDALGVHLAACDRELRRIRVGEQPDKARRVGD